MRGLQAMQSGRAAEAEELFAQAVDACPRDDRARKRYADALLTRGAVDEAIAQMEQAIRLSGDDPQLRVELGEIYLQRGDIEYASRLAEETLREHNQLASAWSLKGKVDQRRGDLEGALAAFHRSLSNGQRDPNVQKMIARIYRQQQRPLRAYSTIQRLARETPPEAIDAELRALQGLALKDLGRLGQAANYLREALVLDPNSSELYYQLAETLLMDGDRANAQLTIAQGRERFPSDERLVELANRQLVLPGDYQPDSRTIR
jgi:tetratricopeptide (TPR) repeat protein